MVLDEPVERSGVDDLLPHRGAEAAGEVVHLVEQVDTFPGSRRDHGAAERAARVGVPDRGDRPDPGDPASSAPARSGAARPEV
jgi:hypothetical protein